MSITLTEADKVALRTAAYGAVELMTTASIAGSPHRAATNGWLALTSATGLVGHVLAEKQKGEKLDRKSAARLADQVLPALTATMGLLKSADPAEAANFHRTVTIAVEAAAQTEDGRPSPPVTAMHRKITEALDAA
ncbi:hypothetical protein AB0I28_35860 [Phytomonospora sp. NPDC050363]|uniref:hypothetical protein n=1 Tax=Phytomonospora sp. NPDC050363 TaxID=3155642 RepID=UPI0033D121A0